MEDLKHLVLVLVGILIAFTVVMTMVAYTVLAERRVLGFIQGRLGPNRVGPQGLLQPLADLLKFILKEDIVPDKSTRFVYFLAPVIATTAALMTIVVYPFVRRFICLFSARSSWLLPDSTSRCCTCSELRRSAFTESRSPAGRRITNTV